MYFIFKRSNLKGFKPCIKHFTTQGAWLNIIVNVIYIICSDCFQSRITVKAQ